MLLPCTNVSEKQSEYGSAVFGVVLFVSCTFSGLLYRESRKNSGAYQPKTPFVSRDDTTNYKRILFWTAWNAQRLSFSPNNQPDWLNGCPEARCLFVTSRTGHQRADALFFSMPDLIDLSDIPHERGRQKHQYYIFFNDESPDTTKELMPWQKWDRSLPNFFNLTMTYRRDSDVWSDSYMSGYRPHIMNLTGRDPLWFQGKRDVLWLVSHCKTSSKREEYVRRLSHYIKVDTYGKCDSPDPCRVKKTCDLGQLLGKYKFYLSFENSFCNDYVTEKLTRALNSDVVPIVLGAANYSAYFPESAVINVENFESPRALAKYLKTLIENETLYERHLAWKYPGQPVWHIPGLGPGERHGFCQLCQLLHRPPETRIQKVYRGVRKWFIAGQCREPNVQFKRAQHARNDSYLATILVG